MRSKILVRVGGFDLNPLLTEKSGDVLGILAKWSKHQRPVQLAFLSDFRFNSHREEDCKRQRSRARFLSAWTLNSCGP